MRIVLVLGRPDEVRKHCPCSCTGSAGSGAGSSSHFQPTHAQKEGPPPQGRLKKVRRKEVSEREKHQDRLRGR